MSSGRTHRLVNVTTLIVPGAAVLGGGYFLSTVGVHPDQDIRGRMFAERRGLWGSFLHYWSMPYGWLFTHNGISHEHFIGTVTRVLFMGLWLLPVVPILALAIPWKTILEYSEWAFLGLTVADSMHIAADGGRKQREH